MASEKKSRVSVIFGAMTIGREGVEQARIHDLKEVGAMLDLFQEHGGTVVDIARVYGLGSSEEAQITHSAQDLRKHLKEFLKALKTDSIDLWYLHGSDRSTPFEETLKACNELHRRGKFKRLGLHQLHGLGSGIAYISELCTRQGWVRPTVYQGVYNAIHRTVEIELFPGLKNYGIIFYAFSPLAGSQLTGRYRRNTRDTDIEPMSRFDPNTFQGRKYRKRLWNDTIFDALDLVREAAGAHQLTEVECALRWIAHHSKLDVARGDAVIIGASSKKQIEEYLGFLEQGPLPSDVVDALDKAWLITKGTVNNYWH
ncbi:unnamed protein product [Clonostachys chloroleuca]|uniref:NADP-dependent oxidoreductase domain-containing protein n=1 Tax=Clonostachys chloroleuca TaxID=1926264 RepID=A0AA35QBL1_9HYPO|nr:unnamed protein product [Clonostachys chloroleuca]